jgi:hypothetical protein
VGDDRHPTDRLDASRLRDRAHVPSNPAAEEIDRDKSRLQICRHQRNFGPKGQAGERTRRNHKCSGSGDKRTAIHNLNTAAADRGVPISLYSLPAWWWRCATA